MAEWVDLLEESFFQISIDEGKKKVELKREDGATLYFYGEGSVCEKCYSDIRTLFANIDNWQIGLDVADISEQLFDTGNTTFKYAFFDMNDKTNLQNEVCEFLDSSCGGIKTVFLWGSSPKSFLLGDFIDITSVLSLQESVVYLFEFFESCEDIGTVHILAV